MTALKRLLNLGGTTLTVAEDVEGQIYVHYTGADVKDGMMLRAVSGRGGTVEEACQDYLDQISGKTLVIDAFGTRREVTVL